LPKLEFNLPPIPKDITPLLGEIFFEHLNKIHKEFYNYSNNVLRTLERAHSTIDTERLNEIQNLTLKLLKCNGRFHLRGAVEYIRNKIKTEHQPRQQKGRSSSSTDPFKILLENAMFKKEFDEATASNKLVLNDAEQNLARLYHSLSKHAHGTNTKDNITIDAESHAPLEVFVLGVLFKRYNIPFKYTNKQDELMDFPYDLCHITPGQ
jgi:hypothetical protein